MFCSVFLTLFVLCWAENASNVTDRDSEISYHGARSNETVTIKADNPYLKLIESEDANTTGIEYLQDIDEDTGLTIRVTFGDKDGLPDSEYTKEMGVNICHFFETNSTIPSSDGTGPNSSSSLALSGLQCPIVKGQRWMSPYIFPTEFSSENITCGEKYYEMRIETANQTSEDEFLMTLKMDILIPNDNETCIESSSAVLSLPTFTASILFTLFVINFTDKSEFLTD